VSRDSSEGLAPVEAADGAASVSDRLDPRPPTPEPPRPRTVPRPTVRKPADNAADNAQDEPNEPPPRLPEIDAALADDGAETVRRPATDQAETEGPPEIDRFLSPPPPKAESPSGGAEGSGAPRRRSRRTVKIPDDAVPQKTPAPPVVATVAEPPPPPPQSKPPLPVIPPAPPVPTLTPKSPAELAGPPPVEMFEVIQPMRIIAIGSQPPAAAMPAVSPAPDEGPPPLMAPSDWEEPSRTPSRPPMPAMAEIEAVAAPPPVAAAPKPPVVEEVEAIAADDDDEETVDRGAAPTLRTEEIESIPDDEIEADRISDISSEVAASNDEIPVVVSDSTPPPAKKPPPPPPKRPASLDGAPASLDKPPVAAAAPEPPPAPPAAPPAPPAAPPAPPAAPPPARPLAQTVDITGGKKRQKPWWEEIFSDDYLRTMEKVEPKIIRKECDFIEDRLGLEKGAVMLDLACGAGAHAVELSSRGYNVVGYDLSLAMLARAQDEALDRGQRINFLQGDMREMAFEEAFDGIYCWNMSFGYFDDEKNVEVLTRVRRGLRQGGMFLLDVSNRDYICPRQPSLVWFEGDGCVCMDEMHVDFFTSRLRVKRTVMFEDGRAKECDYGIRLYGLHELGKMLHETGFKVVEVTGHPAHPGVFFGSESPRIIILAERA
jgi:SAM-dependent methyltransferase